jgi:hypothetical protein
MSVLERLAAKQLLDAEWRQPRAVAVDPPLDERSTTHR